MFMDKYVDICIDLVMKADSVFLSLFYLRKRTIYLKVYHFTKMFEKFIILRDIAVHIL